MSCRVIERQIEYAFLKSALKQIAAVRDTDSIEFNFQATAKNEPALVFLKNICLISSDVKNSFFLSMDKLNKIDTSFIKDEKC